MISRQTHMPDIWLNTRKIENNIKSLHSSLIGRTVKVVYFLNEIISVNVSKTKTMCSIETC